MVTNTLTTIHSIIEEAKNAGIVQLCTDETLSSVGNQISIKGQALVNFGSCSYMGLELDQRIKDKMIEVVQKHGSQFASSRAYVSISLYEEAEYLLSQIFEAPLILAPTITLGHLSNIPVLIGENDAVILDQSAHASIQNAVSFLSSQQKMHVSVVRHNDIEALRQKVQKIHDQYDKVWYMADGVYSMFGDFAPMKEIDSLFDEFSNFNLYVDDAHGMGWSGKNGNGTIFSKVKLQDRLFFTTSLAKSFASAGGVMVYSDEDTKNKVRNCGGTMTFAGPIQPALLGALIASATIHLQPAFSERQAALRELMMHFINTCHAYNLPLVNDAVTPIFYIGVGKPEIGYKMVKRLKEAGFFVNLAVFPAVSLNKTGLRIPITLHHSKEQIGQLLAVIAEELPKLIIEENYSMKKINRVFKLDKVLANSIA